MQGRLIWKALTAFIAIVTAAWPCTAAAASGLASLSYPANNQQGVPGYMTFQWSSVAGAQAYYLWVGTSQGAEDVVNTGQTQNTSYTVPTPLPAGVTLWARIWTEVNGSWFYQSDVNFTVAGGSVLTAPVNGQLNISAYSTFQWTAVPGAQAYELDLGLTAGAKDVLTTGSIQGTTYKAINALPVGATVWARLWTELNGAWSYQRDISFTVSGLSVLTNPANTQQGVPGYTTFHWTPVAGVQAYYLYVGTTQGAKDVVNTGETQNTSYTVTQPLPVGATLWARIWTELNGYWYYQGDISFAVSGGSYLSAPLNTQLNVSAYTNFQWNATSAAQAYQLDVGTTEGGKDVLTTGSIQGTSYTANSPLPTGATLWARLWTELNGAWSYQQDISFSVSGISVLTNPVNNQQNVPGTTTFQWTPVPGVQAYYLYVGTTEDGKDVVNTGETQNTSYAVTTPLPAGSTLWARIWTELNGIWLYQRDISFTVAGGSVLTTPTNNQSNVSAYANFQWNSTSGAQAYKLDIGTAEGGNDVLTTGAIQGTSYAATNALPTGTTLWARLWTELNGAWSYQQDISFTVSGISVLTNPINSQQNVPGTTTFQWTPVAGVQAYYLYVGTTEGAKDVVNTGETQNTSYAVTTPLPAGSTLWARIYTELNGVWQYQGDISFTVAGGSVLTAPSNRQADVSAYSARFQWTTTTGAQAYKLDVGTSEGGNDVLTTGAIQGTSYTAANPLPTGATLWARLWTELNGTWSYQQDISFTVSGLSVLTNPVNNQQNVPGMTTFQWTPVSGVQAYYLYVGTTEGAKDVVNTGETPNTSYTMPTPLPAGSTLWARIYTELNGVWQCQGDISFTVSGGSYLTAPANQQTNVPAYANFQWTATTGAQAYELDLGTTQGAKDVLTTGAIQGTSYTVPTPLTPGTTVWARLWTELNGTWSNQGDISFTESGLSVLTNPANNQQNVPVVPTFQWTTSSGAQAYYLYVGSSQGASDIVNTGEIQSTSYTVPTPLPTGATLWARIWTEQNGSWLYQNDVSFTVSPAAQMIYPANAAQNVDTTAPFQWTTGTGVQAYALYVGTSSGASDVFNSGTIHATSLSVPPLPVGQTLYATVASEVNGTWVSSPSLPFTAALRFGYPAIQAAGIDPTVAFTWSAANGANGSFHLSIGSTPGANDIYDNADLEQSSFTVPSNVLPTGSVLYGTISITGADGVLRTASTVFTIAGSAVAPSQMVYPTDGMTNADASEPFEWTPTDMAQAYRLQISNGTSTVVDSGPISVPRYFAETLALGSYTGQIGTEIAGQWYWTSFSFTVTNTGASMANEVASALWATDYVRNMASFSGFAYSWTNLESQQAPTGHLSTGSICVDYRNALLAVLSQMNVAGREPANLQPQALPIAFMWDTVDEHTLVQFWNTDQQRWMLLDPTFDLTVTRASDGTWATVEDMNTATLNQAWTSVNYQFLGQWGNAIATAYYLDYPLLYLNIPPALAQGQGQDPMPYLNLQLGPPIYEYNWNTYTFQCSGTATLVLNGVAQQATCDGVDSLSGLVQASTVTLPDGSTNTVTVYSPVRNVF